ncbi:hypothetical protein LHP98_00270 [Rhodobacter sp. Har01]|uniref:hypothetical protein n=1 Tax=Rhodobacter sp. Har01 TaxID=2883999 RepID=UPI001D078F60|nr:hypothetical protein [Rhodobacter sp. Har01]MCB6176563.1 hypothetical protein [Rhodobacter sp. Har01]
MFDRLRNALKTLHVPSVEEMELRYLEGSVSRVDLERRQREIDGGMFRRSSRYY